MEELCIIRHSTLEVSAILSDLTETHRDICFKRLSFWDLFELHQLVQRARFSAVMEDDSTTLNIGDPAFHYLLDF